MARPVTLFTGQWADLPFEELGRMTREFGYDGNELACWGDHFNVTQANSDPGYPAYTFTLPDKMDPEQTNLDIMLSPSVAALAMDAIVDFRLTIVDCSLFGNRKS